MRVGLMQKQLTFFFSKKKKKIGVFEILIAILCNHQPKFGTHGHGF